MIITEFGKPGFRILYNSDSEVEVKTDANCSSRYIDGAYIIAADLRIKIAEGILPERLSVRYEKTDKSLKYVIIVAKNRAITHSTEFVITSEGNMYLIKNDRNFIIPNTEKTDTIIKLLKELKTENNL